MSSWLNLVLTATGGGTVGSVVATFGAQTKDRRSARAQARASLRLAERTARSVMPAPPHAEILAALDDFETSAMLADLPSRLVSLYSRAALRHWAAAISCGSDAELLASAEVVATGRVALQAARLLTASTWHPWLSTPRRIRRTRRLGQILDAANPVRAELDRTAKRNLRDWERAVLSGNSSPIDKAQDAKAAAIRSALRASGG